MKTEKKKEPAPAQEAKNDTASGGIFGIDTKIVLAVVAALMLIVVAIAFFPKQPAAPSTVQPDIIANGTANTSSVGVGETNALLSSLSKLSKMPDTYRIEYKRPIDFDIFFTVQYQDEKTQMGGLRTPYNNRSVFMSNGTPVFCEQINGAEKKCVAPVKPQNFLPHMYGIEYMFVDKAGAKNAEKLNRKLVDYGALKLEGGAENKTIAGRSCKEIKYAVNFDNLTLSQISELNVATQYGTLTHTECLDDEFGLPLEQKVEYAENGQNRSTYFIITSFETPAKRQIEMPKPNAGEEETYKEILKVESMWEAEVTCSKLNATSADECFRSWAVENDMPDYCGRIANTPIKEACYSVEATKLQQEKYCANAGALSDDCYYQVATVGKKPGACGFVMNATVKAECLNATKKA